MLYKVRGNRHDNINFIEDSMEDAVISVFNHYPELDMLWKRNNVRIRYSDGYAAIVVDLPLQKEITYFIDEIPLDDKTVQWIKHECKKDEEDI
jgi:hypothetical protein